MLNYQLNFCNESVPTLIIWKPLNPSLATSNVLLALRSLLEALQTRNSSQYVPYLFRQPANDANKSKTFTTPI